MDRPEALAWIIAIVPSAVTLVVVTVLILTMRRQQRRATAWGRRILEVQEEHRRHVAGELHDHLLGQLWRLRGMVEPTAPPEAFEQLASISNRIRSISHRLYPPRLDEGDLAQVLDRLASSFRDSGKLRVEFVADGLPAIGEEIQLALYRVAEEALMNASKHAEAGLVRITVVPDDAGNITLSIADDGPGPRDGHSHPVGFGIRSMRERMEMIGGSLSVTANPGGGTLVVATTAPAS